MSPWLKLGLWIGKLVDWDKDAIRIVLFVGALFTAAFLYDAAIKPVIFPEPTNALTDAETERIKEMFLPSPRAR
jgi:hypothetical protein